MSRFSWLHYPVVLLFVGTLLLWFAASLRPVQSSAQYDFDSWLDLQRESLQGLVRYVVEKAEAESSPAENESGAAAPTGEPSTELSGDKATQDAREGALLHPISLAELPTLRLELQRAGESEPTIYRIDPTLSPERPQQILRLLELMKESGVFGISDSTRILGQGGAVVRILAEGPSRKFETILTQEEVEQNIKTLLLLKLFHEFSRSSDTIAVAQQHAVQSATPSTQE